MVINHLERLFVTSDTSTIVTELEVAHPAANLIVMAAKAQEAEIGDGTNLVRSHHPLLSESHYTSAPQVCGGTSLLGSHQRLGVSRLYPYQASCLITLGRCYEKGCTHQRSQKDTRKLQLR